MQIQVLSRSDAAKYTSDVPWAAISISCSEDWPQLSLANRVDLLRLKFKDVDLPGRDGGISDDQARQIIDFVRKNAGKIDTLLVHCLMGQSRSPGVAAAVYKLLTDADDSYFFKRHTPNRMVYSTILGTAHGLGHRQGYLLDEEC